jgi:hypothetical protein
VKNFAFDLAYEVRSERDEPTYEEHLAGLLHRVASFLADEGEGRSALMVSKPFDVYDEEEEEESNG